MCLVTPSVGQTTNPNYDSALAIRLGAEDNGMKKYVLVILKSGENTSEDKQLKDSAFAGHMKNIQRLAKEGKLIVAGPLGKNDKSYRGIFIFNVPTIEEASKLVKTDPAVNAGYLDAELYSWYGSAALPEYMKYDEKVWKSRH